MSELTKSEKKLFDKAARLVSKEIEERSSFHTELVSKIEKYWKHFNGEQSETAYDMGLAKTFPKETFTHVETWVPRLTSLLTNVYPFFGLKELGYIDPKLKMAVRKSYDNIKNMLMFDVTHSELEDKFEEAMRSLCVEGSLCIKIGYDMSLESFTRAKKIFEEKTVVTQKLLGIPVAAETQLVPKVVYEEINRPKFIANFCPRDMVNIYLDDEKPFDKQSKIEECELTWEEFMQDDKYKNKDTVKELIYDKATDEEKARGVSFRIFERWGDFIFDEDSVDFEGKRIYDEGVEPYPVKSVIVVLKDHKEVAIRLDKNPFNHGRDPYLFTAFTPRKINGVTRLHGLGICEMLFSDQVELADTHNQVIDNKTMLLWGELLVNRGAGIKKKHWYSRKPGKVIFHNAPTPEQAVGRVTYPDFTATGMNMEAIIRRDMVSASGAQMPLQGGREGGRETATSIERRVREAGKRIGLILQRVEDCIILPFLEMSYSLDIQYRDDSRINEILNGAEEPKLQYGKTDVVADFAFELYGAARMENDMIRRKEAENRLVVLREDPLTNQFKLRTDFWETQGVDDPAAYINPEPMYSQTQVQEMIAKITDQANKAAAAKKNEEKAAEVKKNLPTVDDILKSANPIEGMKQLYGTGGQV